MQPAKKPIVFNNFEITLSIIDAGLRIEATDLSSGYEFSRLLDSSSAKRLTENYPLDIEMVHQLLKDFFESKPAKVQSSLSLDGKLDYSCLMSIGNITKEIKFTIQLEKKEIDPMMRIEKSVITLSNKFADLQKTLMEKLEVMDNRIRKLEASVFPSQSSTYSPTFNSNGAFASYYSISNNNRTASATTGSPYSLFAREPVPKDKKVRFSFLIEKENWIMVGIAPGRALKNALSCNDELSFGYGNNGYIYNSKNSDRQTLNKYKAGDKISYAVDLTNGEVVIELNGNYCFKHTFDKTVIEFNDFYPFIYTNSAEGAGATLL